MFKQRWQDVLDRLSLEKRQFWGRSGDPLTATFTLANANDFPIKDFTVLFTFHGNSGTEIGRTKQTFYEIVQSKRSKTINKARIGFMPNQGVSVSAEVVDFGIP